MTNIDKLGVEQEVSAAQDNTSEPAIIIKEDMERKDDMHAIGYIIGILVLGIASGILIDKMISPSEANTINFLFERLLVGAPTLVYAAIVLLIHLLQDSIQSEQITSIKLCESYARQDRYRHALTAYSVANKLQTTNYPYALHLLAEINSISHNLTTIGQSADFERIKSTVEDNFNLEITNSESLFVKELDVNVEAVFERLLGVIPEESKNEYKTIFETVVEAHKKSSFVPES
jgi:hypothetical protein